MSHLFNFLALVFLIGYSSAFYISAKNSFILTSQNFTQGIKDSDIFVLFIEDPEHHDKFLELWDEVGQVAQAEESSKNLKFGIVDCNKNKDLCIENRVTRKIELKFFGKKNNWKDVTVFLDATISDVLREETLIQKFDQPGNLFVLFKVNYCPYCKETMDEWVFVNRHFKKNPNVFVASIDCTRHRPYCAKYDALKFPRMRFIHNPVNGAQVIEKYDGEREARDMIEYCESNINRFKK